MGNRSGLPAGVGLFRPRPRGSSTRTSAGSQSRTSRIGHRCARPSASLSPAGGRISTCQTAATNDATARTIGLPPVLRDQEERQRAVKRGGLRNQGEKQEQTPLGVRQRSAARSRSQPQGRSTGAAYCAFLPRAAHHSAGQYGISTSERPSDQHSHQGGAMWPKGKERRTHGRLRREQKAERRNHRRRHEQRGPLAVRDGLEEAGGQGGCRQPSAIPRAREAEGIARHDGEEEPADSAGTSPNGARMTIAGPG